MQFKKIEVCHGKSCGSHGGPKIKKILEETYAPSGVEITERLCCGRCEHFNTIVVDEQKISDLDPHTLTEQFIADPQRAVAEAQKKDQDASERLDAILDEIV
ncbi:MAG: (2Fe-2S) ferredoxin domain-containing protein [bacterium]|nr:(2Fe-2S) ferredoxin domain-containing protein [bacterium]